MMNSREPAQEQLNFHARNNQPGTLHTSAGAPVDSLTTSMTAGKRGPILLQDHTLLDYHAAFNRERIPERVVHAKGAAAHGYFEVTHDVTKYTRAKIFSKIGKQTPCFLRFSTVGGESGSADTARDPRGFAVKFKTEDGIWDLVGNNTPIFFIRDPVLFPSFIHTQKRNPATHLKDPDMFWDFISLRPETTHQVSFLFSDRGTPDGYRHLNGYGSHTFKLVNEKGVPVYCKFHFKCDQGIKNLSAERADQLAGADPDYAIRDLYNAIAQGDFPSWTLKIQVMTYEQAEKFPFNPFDLTKVWPQSEFPLVTAGRLVLNRNSENYFAEVEQSAFAPGHLVPGIEPSPDKMLQLRLQSYHDTHRHRLGTNHKQIPINCPFANSAIATNYQRDGAMQMHSQKGAPNYFPNSFNGPQPSPDATLHSDKLACDVARWNDADDDNFTQTGIFYRQVLSSDERDRLTSNIAGHIVGAQEFIRRRAIANFSKADPDYGSAIQKKVDQILSSRSRL